MDAHFDLRLPERGDIPLVVEVPHAGIDIPSVLREEIVASQDSVLRDADLFVDRLYERAPIEGATFLSSRISRYVVDLNRAPDDIDSQTVPDHPSPRPSTPRGVCWRIATDGATILRQPLSYSAFVHRIQTFHATYHTSLQQELERIRERFGFVILLAAHSMPSIGRSEHNDAGRKRADVVPGTLGATSADPRIISAVDTHFRAAGLSVVHDDPYRGGWTTSNYGNPTLGVHAIQIELNRALYMNETTFKPKRESFPRLQKSLDDLITKLGKLKL